MSCKQREIKRKLTAIYMADIETKTIIIKDKERPERKPMEDINPKWFEEKAQFGYITQLCFNYEFNESAVVKRELTNKLAAYKQQDLRKNIYDETKFIKFDELINLLTASRLMCKYCNNCLYILYEQQREKLQWTLDRINNDEGHNYANVCVACLDCNLRRKRLNADKFLFSKKMIVCKEES